MSVTDGAGAGRRLGRSSWTMVAGIFPIVSIVTFAAVVLSGQLPLDREWIQAIFVCEILGGVALGVLWGKRAGVETVHARVAAARWRWVESWPGAVMQPDAAPDTGDVALALPRRWRAESARARVWFPMNGLWVRAETWVLKPGPLLKRSPRRREIVGVNVSTGPVLLCVDIGATIDPLHVMPSWAGRSRGDEPAWFPAVRDRVAAHKDTLASLAIGYDRVILFALDDPRPETMVERARLVTDVAAIIQEMHRGT